MNPGGIAEMYNRFGANWDDPAFQHGLTMGRGLVELELTAEQLARLKDPPEDPM